MTSKERVALTVAHKEPDRVPLGEWGIDHDHVERVLGRPSFWRNRKATTLALWQGRRDEVVESLKRDCLDLGDALGYDVLTVHLVESKHRVVKDPPREISEGVWMDKAGNVYKYAASNDSIMQVQDGRQSTDGRMEINESDVNEAMARLAHAFDDESRFELIDYVCEKRAGTHAVLSRDIDIYGQMMSPFGGDYSFQLVLATLEPEQVKRMMGVCLERNRLLLDRLQKKGVMIAMQGYDYGMNSGTILRPDTIRDVYMPAMKGVNQLICEHGMIPFFHCCGNVWSIMDDFVDAGYKGYQSIQESAGMDNAKMKRLYGDKITMWTGVQCETLVMGTAQQLHDEVMRNLELLMPGGGFIFGSTNSVQFGANTDRYLQAIDLLRKHGNY